MLIHLRPGPGADLDPDSRLGELLEAAADAQLERKIETFPMARLGEQRPRPLEIPLGRQDPGIVAEDVDSGHLTEGQPMTAESLCDQPPAVDREIDRLTHPQVRKRLLGSAQRQILHHQTVAGEQTAAVRRFQRLDVLRTDVVDDVDLAPQQHREPLAGILHRQELRPRLGGGSQAVVRESLELDRLSGPEAEQAIGTCADRLPDLGRSIDGDDSDEGELVEQDRIGALGDHRDGCGHAPGSPPRRRRSVAGRRGNGCRAAG